jgi:ABC-type Zn uptake system ZnuABC Zn-binding protein ZnuA
VLGLAVAAAPGCLLAQERLRVVATSPDLKALVEAVGRERVEVESLISPTQDPHTVEVKPAQLARVRAAALLIRVGLDHEPWFARLKVPEKRAVLDASRSVTLSPNAYCRGCGRNAARTSTRRATRTTGWIRRMPSPSPPTSRALCAAFPRMRRPSKRIARLRRRRSTEDRRLAGCLAPFRGTELVVMHDSWAYFREPSALTSSRLPSRTRACLRPRPSSPRFSQRMREAG